MGLNACSCLRNFDDLSYETDLNGDGEIEGFIIPNNNHNLFSSTDDSTNLTGAGRMSYLMKVNTYDSGTLKNTAFSIMKTGNAVERIQSVFRGSNFRKKFKKNINEELNEIKKKEKEKEKEKINEIEKINEKYEEEKNIEELINNISNTSNDSIDKSKESIFISEKTKKAEKNFEGKLDYENGWKKYIDQDNDNSESNNKEIFSQEKINDIINNKNLISTKEDGDIIIINNETCLFKGQMEKNEFNDNKKELTGKGELYLKNGEKYEGIFINGKLNGIGRYINDKCICYEGIFNNGILEGKGIRIKTGEDGNKRIYKGDLKNYKKEGKGRIECKTYIYEGDFVNDKKKGKGKLIYNENGNMYEGEFDNDDINGYGLYTFKNKHSYEGEFLNGFFHGKGLYKWPDGCYFKGEYIKGVREGNGEYKFSDGKIYKGPFSNGKPNGIGIINIDGNNFNCEFKNGKLVTDLKSSRNTKRKRKK